MTTTPKINELQAPGTDLVTDREQLRAHAVDGIQPKALAFPRQREDVAHFLTWADTNNQKVLACGSGTKLCIGRMPERLDVVLKLELLNRVVEHDYQNLTVTVEAGTRLSAVQAVLRERSQFLPLDPPFGERATIGGVLATNSSGPRRGFYGSPRDLVLGMSVALADGRIIRVGGKTVKNVAGFDLAKLFIGSLGTLGVILEATFRVRPLPETSSTQILRFGGLDSASAMASRLLASPLLPSAVVLLNPTALSESTPDFPKDNRTWGLAVACEGFVEAVKRSARDIVDMAPNAPIATLTGQDERLFWQRLTNYLPNEKEAPSKSALRGKISVPLRFLEKIVTDLEEYWRTSGILGATVAHAGSGIVYFFSAGSHFSIETLLSLRKRVNGVGGWLTLELAPSALKRRVDVWDSPPGGLQIMKRIRDYFDPKRTLSPGRYLPGL